MVGLDHKEKKWIPRTEVLIFFNPHKPESRRPEGCLWINTDVRGIYLTYFMIIFLRDLDKNENTYVYLTIIKIKPSFRCLFYHHSIIKMFCLREQSTSHVHAHTSIELKKNNDSYKIVSFWQGFEKRFVASSMEFSLFFMVSLLSCFDYFRVRLFSRSVHAFL